LSLKIYKLFSEEVMPAIRLEQKSESESEVKSRGRGGKRK
jgi:hypothetical protein